ncbi:MAG TPA: DUF2752 domain-containing protein [Dysgonamonadaceae bacterium]|nr:DUF2752 domain-containing protein [Dysgonamonadaceae bacterium]
MVVAILVATVLIIFFYIDPNIYPFFPKCPFLTVTGLECPGCGSQRAFHQLLHLNIAGAFKQNPLVVIFGPYILLGLYIEYIADKNKFKKVKSVLFGNYAAITILVVIMGYWIGRNIF